ncbi:MAG: DUF1573 domain-containing protein [Bacteroidales bacterium]|nr:DUF1573 domain-containing protein [Bacteroidales bacterium]
MKQYSLIIGFTFISLVATAQKLSFDKTEHNFQQIKETDGEVSCEFSYENRTKSTIYLMTVENSNRTSIRLKWSTDTIQPKEKGSFSVTLQPRNLSGLFEHTVIAKTMENGVEYSYPLNIKAVIEPRPRTKEEIYGMMEGNLRYKTNSLRYTMNPTSVIIDTFGIYNVYGETMTFSYGMLPQSIQILSMPEKLAPKEEGKIVFKYSAAAKNDWGNVWDKVTIVTSDTNRPQKSLYITGEIFDDFDSWTPEQKANAPKASFDNIEYLFGTATEGDEVTHTYIITNTGKSTLHIRKLKQSCGCTVVNPEKNDLEPEESTGIKAVFRTYGKTGKQMRTIDVITNDPSQPKITLKITGNLNPKPVTTE